jgi:membrane peptidoglycan carboxypeptidase
MAASDRSSARDGRSVPGVVIQSLYLLVGMIAVSAIAGVLLAALFLPAVSATSKVTEDGVDLFDSFPSQLEVEPLNEASRIEASDGSLLATFYSQNRIMVPLDEISPYLQKGVVSVEDRRFYEHGGIDLQGTIRAFASNAGGSATQGGSSLTQQYVKNALLMDAEQRGDKEAQQDATEQSYGRKAREMKLAIALEKKWSKDEILNGYLNVAQFGPSQYGVQTAAQHYFSKDAKDLDPGESALLAGITNSPNGNDPVAHPKQAEKRRNQVLRDMKRDDVIDQKQLDKYSDQPVKKMLKVKDVQAGCESADKDGFFCDYVTRSLMNDPSFGKSYDERRKLLFGGGLTIKTTLDPKKQKTAQDILDRRVPPDSQSGFGHAIVTVEPGTGKIETMAQNRTFNPHQDAGKGETAVNYTVPHELGGGNGFPVGSTFKTFTLTDWIEKGKSIYDKVPTARGTIRSFPAHCLSNGRWFETQGYNPDNAVSVPLAPQEPALNATKFSVNTAYANMAKQLDLCDIAEQARTLGAVPATFNPLDEKTQSMSIADMYGTELAPAAVVLGELRISALDMANAYATYAAGGSYCTPTGIDKITDRDGKELKTSGGKCKQVIDKKTADTVSWVLEQDLSDPRATGKGKVIPGHDAGGKTGTSGSQYHTWYVGFTKQMSTAVWFGNPASNTRPGGFSVDGEVLQRGKVWGNTVSLPTWQEYMTKVHEGLPDEKFPGPPAGGDPAEAEKHSGATEDEQNSQEGAEGVSDQGTPGGDGAQGDTGAGTDDQGAGTEGAGNEGVSFGNDVDPEGQVAPAVTHSSSEDAHRSGTVAGADALGTDPRTLEG